MEKYTGNRDSSPETDKCVMCTMYKEENMWFTIKQGLRFNKAAKCLYRIITNYNSKQALLKIGINRH